MKRERCLSGLLIGICLISLSSFVSASYMYCVDSDGGNFPEIAGNVSFSYMSVPTPATTYVNKEYCFTWIPGVSSVQEVTSCDGPNCWLEEYICEGSSGSYNMTGLTYNAYEGNYLGCANRALYGVKPTCSDGIQNQNETGIDCGGVCGGVCPTCVDGIKNGQETGIDCGGGCSTCQITTTPNCTDGIRNQDESEIDCGGAYCPDCPTCVDGIKNGQETGIDCGGGCVTCPIQESYLEIQKGNFDPGNHNWTSLGASGNKSEGSTENYNIMVQFSLLALQEKVNVTMVGIKSSGSGDDRKISPILVFDLNGNGIYDDMDEFVAGGFFNQDNAEYSFSFPYNPQTVRTDKKSYFLIIYNMDGPFNYGDTFSLQLVDVVGTSIPSGFAVYETSSISNTKTISRPNSGSVYPGIGQNCYNGVRDFDESGVDCGGAYCPACGTPDVCRNDSCVPGDFVCEDGTVKLCVSGIWNNAPNLYDEFCYASRCDPESVLCFSEDRSVMTCNEDGSYMERGTSEEMYSLFCENLGCDSGEKFCFEGDLYTCENNEYLISGGDPYCEKITCNLGDFYCDDINQEFLTCNEFGQFSVIAGEVYVGQITANIIVTNQNDWVSNYEYYCLGARDSNTDDRSDRLSCDILGEQRCNFVLEIVEYCQGNGLWGDATHGEGVSFEESCGNRECNHNWFSCNPIERKVAFCDNNGLWGAAGTQGYEFYCEPRGPTPGGNTNNGARFSQGETRTIIGEVRNNTIIIHQGIPSFNTIKEKETDKFKVSWIMIAGIVIALAIAILFIIKYYRLAQTVKAKGSKK